MSSPKGRSCNGEACSVRPRGRSRRCSPAVWCPLRTVAGGRCRMPELAVFLAALAVLLGLARIAGTAAARLGQPAVLGEILCGVAVGPAVRLLPPPVGGTLTALAQLGLVLFLFAAGA